MESKATIKPDTSIFSEWNFKTAKQVFGVASALIFFKSNSFIKDFFDVDTA
jgi:hypothetical protein